MSLAEMEVCESTCAPQSEHYFDGYPFLFCIAGYLIAVLFSRRNKNGR